MPFRGLTNFFHMVGNAQRMSAEYERMSSMSGERLAEIGLERGDIATHVYRKYNKIR